MKTATLALCLLPCLLLGACGGGGGTAQPDEIADSVLRHVRAREFDRLYDYMDPAQHDSDALWKLRQWRIEKGYETWPEFKKQLDGDGGLDPRAKSGIEAEDAWKRMAPGKHYALHSGFYRALAADEIDARLEGPWARESRNVNLAVEGQGNATVKFANGYGDEVEVRCVRRDGLWYLYEARIRIPKEVPPKPKAE